MERIYLDNAATSWPKPPEVLQAIQDFYLKLGSASGRGGQSSEFSSDHLVRQCRAELTEFLGAGKNDALVFAFNGTDAINLGLWGVLGERDHVVTTAIEHNSVIRPLHELSRHRGVTFDIIECNDDSFVDAESVSQAINNETRLVVVSHASNVTGAVQDIGSIAAVCREKGVALMVDAAQTVGHMEVDFRELQCDLLAAPGHKGLMGPLGTGFLLVGENLKDTMKTWRAGGTGTESELAHQPNEYPAKLESGNLNVSGIAGLLAGLRFVRSIGVAKIAEKEQALLSLAAKGLSLISDVQIICSGALHRTGVLSFEVVGQDPREIAMNLDSSFGIQVRDALH